jgi:glycosyltransferase involved in cell wall biosynthesis
MKWEIQMDQLRIAIVAPPWFSVPPPGYGGIERVVSYLADGLADRGHRVTLFAAGGSRTSAELSVTLSEPPSRSLGDPIVEARHAAMAYARWQEFDVIHDHTMLGLIAGATLPIPVVHTIHGPITPDVAAFHEATAGRVHLVCISNNQRSMLPPGLEATVINNALTPAAYPFSDRHGEYLLFVGRMNAGKGILEAIEIARRARRPLLILAKINELEEQRFFDERVRPALCGVDAEVLCQPPEEVKLQAFRDALATLFPISWPEPFGLVMIESMATGTPVIAFRQGSVPEVIEHERTGFICESVDEAVIAVDRVATLDRKDCRLHVEQRFNAALAVVRHEQLFLQLVQQSLLVDGGG